MLSCGIDILEIEDFDRSLRLGGGRLLRRIFTDRELALCGERTSKLAEHFAVKEAVSKALGTGLRGISARDVEILPYRRQQLGAHLHGAADAKSRELGLYVWAISVSRGKNTVVAVVVVTSSDAKSESDHEKSADHCVHEIAGRD